MKKIKEVDQRPDDSVIIQCNCGFNHYIEFNFNVDESDYICNNTAEKVKDNLRWKEYYISFIDQDTSFWNKLKSCWNYLFSKEANMCHTAIGLTSKDMDKIIEHFNKYKKI